MTSDYAQARGIVDEITRDSEPGSGWTRFDADPEALAWARSETERYLTVIDGHLDRREDVQGQGLMREVRKALYGKPGGVGLGAFDERKPARIARTQDP